MPAPKRERRVVRGVTERLGRVPLLVWLSAALLTVFFALVSPMGRGLPEGWVPSLGANLLTTTFGLLVVEFAVRKLDQRRRGRVALNALWGPFESVLHAVGVTAYANTDPKSGWKSKEIRELWERSAALLDQNMGFIANDLDVDVKNSVRAVNDLIGEILADGDDYEHFGGISNAQDAGMIVEAIKSIATRLGGRPVPALTDFTEAQLGPWMEKEGVDYEVGAQSVRKSGRRGG